MSLSSKGCKFFTDEEGVVRPIRDSCPELGGKKKKKRKLPGEKAGDQITRRKRPSISRDHSPEAETSFSTPSSPYRQPPPPSTPPKPVSSSYYPGFKSRAQPGDVARGIDKMQTSAMMGKKVPGLAKNIALLAEANKLQERAMRGKKTFLNVRDNKKKRKKN